MAQRQLYHQDLPQHATAHSSANLEYMAQPVGISTGWRMSIPGASVGQLFWCLPVSDSCSCLRSLRVFREAQIAPSFFLLF